MQSFFGRMVIFRGALRVNDGDPASPSNYRPVCSISMLYKLFSQLLFKGLQPTLDDKQSQHQAGFRPGYSTTDHLFTFQQLRQRATEWYQPLWVAATSSKKIFRHSGAQQRVDGLEGIEKTIHTATHKTLRPATSISAYGCSKQTVPLRRGTK